MWTLTLALIGRQMLTMNYKSKETAEGALSAIRQAKMTAGCMQVVLHDDYTRTSEVPLASIVGVQITEMEASLEAMITQQLLVARANATIMMKAQDDPKLKLLAARGQMPAIQRPQ